VAPSFLNQNLSSSLLNQASAVFLYFVYRDFCNEFIPKSFEQPHSGKRGVHRDMKRRQKFVKQLEIGG